MNKYFKFDQPIDRKLIEASGNESNAVINIDEYSINQFN